MGRPSGSGGSQKTCRLLHTVPAFGRKARRTMPYPSLTPSRAGSVVFRIFCWPPGGWRTRLLATALRGHKQMLSSLSGIKPIVCVCYALGLVTTHSATAQSMAAPRGTVTDLFWGQPSGTVTDTRGQFRLASRKPSTYDLRDRVAEYDFNNQLITLPAGEVRSMALTLSATNLNLAEVTNSQPHDHNQPLASISPIVQPLSSLNSTHDSLRLVPSLLIAQHASVGIFLHGFDAGFLAHRRLYATRRGDFTRLSSLLKPASTTAKRKLITILNCTLTPIDELSKALNACLAHSSRFGSLASTNQFYTRHFLLFEVER
jgi:hypothetical protein